MSEKLHECKTCKQQIADNAKVCPHCGAKNKKVSPFLVAIIAIVALIAIFSNGGNNDEPVKVGENTTTPSTSATELQNEKTIFALGEIAELKNIQVSLIDVSVSTGSDFNTPSDGNVFVLCEFEITNNSTEELSISSMLSFEAYCDEYACSYSLGALLEKGNKNQLDGTIAAGKKMKGVIGYEVPTDWSELEILFTPDYWSGKDITFIATNN